MLDNNRRFTPNPSSDALRRRFKVSNAPVAAWFDDCMSKNPQQYLTHAMIVQSFRQWCERQGLEPLSTKAFWSQFRIAHPDLAGWDSQKKIDGKATHVCTGVGFARNTLEIAA